MVNRLIFSGNGLSIAFYWITSHMKNIASPIQAYNLRHTNFKRETGKEGPTERSPAAASSGDSATSSTAAIGNTSV